MSLISELNSLTLQGGPDLLSAAVLPGHANNLRSTPYSLTEGQLLPVNSGKSLS